MKKVLIVDDNEINRMLLRTILEGYCREEGHEILAIDEAINGVEAVEKNDLTRYDLIFMDIMMPVMDGIEATRRIRARDPRAMIVAVSAVDEGERQKEILRAGAEDDVSKPINVDIFNARLINYLALVESRRNQRHPHEAKNLFSRDIYTRKISFCIDTEDDLAEFWEYYLLNTKMACAQLSDTVRTLYDLGSIALRLKARLYIWVEESENILYFTMEGISALKGDFVRLVLSKNTAVSDYRSDEDRLSIRFVMQECHAPEPFTRDLSSPAAEPVAAAVPPSIPAEPVRFTQTDAAENRVYDYMDPEDLTDIQDYLGRLNTLLLIVGSGDIHTEEAEEIALYLERVGKIALIYSQSYPIGHALNILSEDIRSHLQGFIDKSASLGALCAAFGRDLQGWIRLIFEEGAPSVNYMDDTIISNAQMIGSMLKMDDAPGDEAVDLDDIFDF